MVDGRKQITKTNFEAITESPKKLAEFLDKVVTYCDDCPCFEACPTDATNCKEPFVNWLNSPAEIAKNDNNEMEV